MIFKDQLQRTVELPHPPERIISLVPSQTELLYELGLGDKVVGITKFCIHPEEWFREKTRVGGTKEYDLEKIAALQPDLIIGNKEENDEEQIRMLMDRYPVWMSDIYDLQDALAMIRMVDEITGSGEKAAMISAEVEKAFLEFSGKRNKESRPTIRTAYLIWRNPYMVAGSSTFINKMMEACGFLNVFSAPRYPEVTAEQLHAAGPDLILLSSEPYPFKEKHLEEFSRICPGAKVLTVDGEMFSWYGSRLRKAPAYFESLLKKIEVL